MGIERYRGEEYRYVYHLVQGVRDIERREQHVTKLVREHGLPSEQVALLRQQLAELDERRAAKEKSTAEYVYVPPPKPRWVNEPATPKQVAALQRFVGEHRTLRPLTKGQARAYLYRLNRLCDESWGTGDKLAELEAEDLITEIVEAL